MALEEIARARNAKNLSAPAVLGRGMGGGVMDARAKASDSWVPQTTQEWYAWLVEEERKTVAAYRDKPSLLIADHRREQDIARDYEGREIFELLQNANDQAAECGERGRVLLELSHHGLIVANTGLAFSVGGVASLQTSHLSPKRRRRRQIIGNKGLGFRAVLNWSHSPIILSQALALAYCAEHLKAKNQALVDQYPEIARVIADEREAGDEVLLPLLPFPMYAPDGDLRTHLKDAACDQYDRCRGLLGEGYNTAIAMPFDMPGGYAAAVEQMAEIGPALLLFAQHLGELCFRQEGKPDIIWRRDGDDELTSVLANDVSVGQWQIHRKGGKLPEAAIQADQSEATDYELVVAVPREESEEARTLYSYFPTDITLPLPLVCHATLELEQSRKHVQQKRACNEHVIAQLAEFVVDIAERAAGSDPHDPWAGMSLLIPTGHYPEELRREGFPGTLLACAKTHKIVPTLSGTPVAATEARSVIGASATWLPPGLFPEVVPVRDAEDLRFLKSLEVQPLPISDFKARLIGAQGLTIEQRVALIDGLLRENELRGAYSSALLLDSDGQPLGDALRVFLPPSGGDAPSIPDWADLRFLNPALREKLARQLGVGDARELQQKLSGFGVREYSLGNVIQALVAEANRAAKESPERAARYQTDLLCAIFALYRAEAPGKKRADYPEQSPVQLPNQAGASDAATALYLGAGLGPHGEIVQELYTRWAPEKLLDAGALPQLTDDTETLADFLLWIGVAKWPRDVVDGKPDKMYLDHLLRTIGYPAAFEEKVVAMRSEASYASVADVRSIDGLEDTLRNADPAAITAWLANDDRATNWGRPAREHARLLAYPHGVTRARSYGGGVPSYVKWRIETFPWLPTGDGAFVNPRDCVLGERAVEDLFPRPAMPPQEVLERFGITPAEIVEAWRRAGVLTSLAFLERDQIYAKLLELPQRSPDGALARALYLWLLDASDIAWGGDGPNRKEFLERGKMWGHHAKEGKYFPISELHHADAEGLPQALLEKLKIVDLRRRVGTAKVQRVFGVRPVDQAGITQRIVTKEIAPGSVDANTSFEEAKPFLHKLRVSQTSEVAQLQRLKDLRLEVCSTLRVELAFEEAALEYDLPVWGWMIEGDKLYVRSDPARPLSFSESLLANAICEALAAIFRLADGGDFARMLACGKEDRPELLRRLRGDSVLEDIEAIKAEYAAFSSRKLGPASFPVGAPPKPAESPAPAGAGKPPEPATPTPAPASPQQPLQVIEQEHVARPAGEQRKLQVKRITSSPRTPGAGQRVTDGDFCERKAMEFEEAGNPPRWPLLVGQIMGTEGPGCDILSFATAEAREAFRQGPLRDLDTVVRFIEVKGRGTSGATIELKGNELAAADRYKDRYFLYRLFEAEDGTFLLTVLDNPLVHKEALRAAVHVVMEQAGATQRFALIGGINREQQ